MARPPTSSSASSRPFTASAARPGTANPSAGFDQHDPQYTYGYTVEEEEEDEESEPEDVFAYLPPTTADQQPEQPPPSEPSYPPHDPSFSYPQPEPPTPNTGSHLMPSLATYSEPPDSAPGPSVFTAAIPVETPPSTASHTAPDAADLFSMRRLDTATPLSGAYPAVSRTSAPSSREVHISLPPGSPEFEKGDHDGGGFADEEQGTTMSKHRQPLSSAGGSAHSAMLTPSVLDDADSIKMDFDFDAVADEEDSPFPEVRASVSNVDDPEMPAMTIRMWFVGLVLCMTAGAMNVFFNFRSPAPSVVPLVLLLLAYPFGKLLAFVLPITTYRLPGWIPLAGGVKFSFNPGPWNIKEHVLVYIMANVAVGPPYALNAIVVSEVFYGIETDFWFCLVLVLATQLTGFGLAGLCRRFLVWPASMVWPQNLVACTLLNTLHAEDDEGTGGISRYKYFLYMFGGAFFFFFLPGYLFEALSIFNWVCWIAPNNIPVNQLFGVANGLGMSVLTFDWTEISWIGSPLMVPWWAEVHIFGGFMLFYWVLVPIFYYTNVWELSHFPITANVPYDRFGKVYDVARVLQTDDRFNSTAYNEYSPLYLPAAYAMTYLLAFALSTCVIVHTLLYHGRSLLNGIKRIRIEKDDIHAKLMRNYPEVPDWWYGASFVLFFSLAIVAVEVWHTDVPVWALLLAVALPVTYVLPSGFIYAMTGQGITVNLLAQIIPSTLLPGNPLANMIFKAYSVQTLSEATSFVQDLKLGHYVKVPPRATFLVQLIATILAAFVQVGVKEWMFHSVQGICKPDQPSHLTCPHNKVFYTASVVWGLIGTSRQFGAGALYNPQLYALAIGAVLPIPFWYWQRKRPNSLVRYMNTPVILNGVSYIPPATGINYSSWFFVAFIFQYLIRRRNFAWWSKFNYVTSAALDSGTAISLIVIFFVLQFPKGGFQLNWWGNTVFQNTADAQGIPWRPIGPEGI